MKMNFCLFLCLGMVHMYSCVEGQREFDDDTLTHILKELKNLKEAQKECANKLTEQEKLKARVLSLESTVKDLQYRVKDLQSENEELVSKINRLEDDKKQIVIANKHVSKTKGTIGDVPTVDNTKVLNITFPLKRKIEKDKKSEMHDQRIRQIADTRVAFSASLSTGGDITLGDHHTVIYDHVFTNIGSAYHPHTGIFIAPYKGAYVFSTKMMAPQGKYIYLEIVIDGNFVDRVLADSSSSHDWVSSTTEWILEVNKGSEVWIRSASQGQLHGYSFSMFSGFLLFETE